MAPITAIYFMLYFVTIISSTTYVTGIKRSDIMKKLEEQCAAIKEDKLNVKTFEELHEFVTNFNYVRRNDPEQVPECMKSLLGHYRSVLPLKRVMRRDNVCTYDHYNDMIRYHQLYIEPIDVRIRAPLAVADLFQNYANQVNILCSTNVNQHLKESEWLVKRDLNELCHLVRSSQKDYRPEEECEMNKKMIKMNILSDKQGYKNALTSYTTNALNYKLGDDERVSSYKDAFMKLIVGSCLRSEQLYNSLLSGTISLSKMGYAINDHKLDKKSVYKWTQVMDLCNLVLRTRIQITDPEDSDERASLGLVIKSQREYRQLKPMEFIESFGSDYIFYLDH